MLDYRQEVQTIRQHSTYGLSLSRLILTHLQDTYASVCLDQSDWPSGSIVLQFSDLKVCGNAVETQKKGLCAIRPSDKLRVDHFSQGNHDMATGEMSS